MILVTVYNVLVFAKIAHILATHAALWAATQVILQGV